MAEYGVMQEAVELYQYKGYSGHQINQYIKEKYDLNHGSSYYLRYFKKKGVKQGLNAYQLRYVTQKERILELYREGKSLKEIRAELFNGKGSVKPIKDIIKEAGLMRNLKEQRTLAVQKGRTTKLERYGDPNYNNSKQIAQTLQQNRAVVLPYPLCDMWCDREAAQQWLDEHPHQGQEDLANQLGVSYATIQHWLQMLDLNYKHLSGVSVEELSVFDFIKTFYNGEIRRNVRFLAGGRELDIYIPDKKVAIEYNGTYFHMNDKYKHISKSKECDALGIRLIHIYDYEWKDELKRPKIELLLRIALGCYGSKIYARKCTVKEISNKEARPFNEAYHLQGHRNAQVTYGLFYEDELVQLMSFSRSRWNRNLQSENSWEIIRGCPGSNNIVIGGVSKLMKHFIREHKPSQLFSYCDFNKFNGVSYVKSRMTFTGYTGPDLNYVLKDWTVRPRNPNKHKEYEELSLGKIWGSGSKKYIMEFTNSCPDTKIEV